MTIVMTVAGVDCDAKVLDNEITCRIPKNMTISREGLPVKVCLAGSPSVFWPQLTTTTNTILMNWSFKVCGGYKVCKSQIPASGQILH